MQTDTKKTESLNLKVRVEQQRDMLRRKAKHSFVATLGDTGHYAVGTCKEGALQLLHSDLTRAKENEMVRIYRRTKTSTFCLYWAGGWAYDIVRDAAPNHASTSFLGIGTTTRQDALARMESHAAQYAESEIVLDIYRSNQPEQVEPPESYLR